MDALSKIFDDIHLNKSEYIYLKPRGDWAYSYQEQDAMIGYVVLVGNMTIQLNPHTQLQVEAGDLVLIPSGQNHSCHSNAKSNLIEALNITALFDQKRQETIEFGGVSGEPALILAIRCHIDTIMARPLLNALPNYIHIHHITGSTAPEWLQIGLHFLAVEAYQIRPGRDKILDHLVSILFIECVRDYIAQLQDSNNWLRALAHTELANALAAIHGKPEQAWTVESLAEQCCMSRSKFATLFSNIVGETPLAYLQQYRFRLASQHLREGQLSIQQIAHRVGYSSETAFSQTFKRLFDLTPSQYRQQFQ
ncbi:cupin domain-containing protein [Acinetobacter terrae]|uniref:AraC family transcriptional regulator n=1 Tax=Acinetobacter terrae TaxID=2731247 RepID=A0A8E4FAK6_9GAMM|nr:AraC family transcriptional regulator [Acinetobacter terrae]NNH40084.1 AraC family transcriptional regulator [Acinetobacter terrae]OAL87783.1 AraC family transcriptional regulator [Acinetobacter terrae]